VTSFAHRVAIGEPAGFHSPLAVASEKANTKTAAETILQFIMLPAQSLLLADSLAVAISFPARRY
jgi:hypothetical protein